MSERIAIVTGGANGIGRAVAVELAAAGVVVAVLDREADAAAEVVQEIGGRSIALPLDVSDSEACRATVAEVHRRFGRIDHLVNSAGSFIAAGRDATDAEWDRILAVNVRGCATMVASVAPVMAAGGGGSIVNIGSVSAKVAQAGRWTYNATKGAITTLTKCQALDLAADGIRVNVVQPGWVWTREVERAAGGDRERWEPVLGRYAMLRRLADPAEIARPTAFLLGEGASFITGAEIPVDGGYLALGPEGLGETASFAGSD